ncbi:MAG: 16S rRNA (cytidine(1402)-2'-O)-methyltransferase [Spirochaetes bacterium]|nr:16S rRNA (cytidine(1402)-2'-O)-methyltransferase [Spirochaetota bacterium]
MSEKVQPSTLYIVSTPIGNLEDITIRALNILKSVDIIACEDTRHSIKLLNFYDIKKKLITYHSYNEKYSCAGILKLLESHKSVALITDGGTPCISDPGYLIVKECRLKGLDVIGITGISAFLNLLTISGFRCDKFFFHGFISPKVNKQKKKLSEMKGIEATHIIYESPHRILKILENIKEIFPDKMICLGKELTKINENIIIDLPENTLNKLKEKKISGEFVILIANY